MNSKPQELIRTAANAQRASGGSAGLASKGCAPAGRACAEAQRRDCYPKMEANAHEMRAIEYLAALDAQVQRTKGTLEQRLRLIPGGWRDICMVTSKINRLLEGVYATMMPRQYHHMEIMADEAEVFVRQKPVVRTANSHLIPVKTDDVRWIVNAVMSLECSICLKNEREQKGCELRKRLMCLAPPLDIPKNRVCPYLHVVTQNDPGDYVKRQDYEG